MRPQFKVIRQSVRNKIEDEITLGMGKQNRQLQMCVVGGIGMEYNEEEENRTGLKANMRHMAITEVN